MRPIDRVFALADERGVKRAFLVKLVDGYRGQATDWKNGKSSPTDENLQVFADYFGVTYNFLVGKEEPTALDGQPVISKHTEMLNELNSISSQLTPEDIEGLIHIAKRLASSHGKED